MCRDDPEIAPHPRTGFVGTDFRHAVEFSRSGRAPSTAFRLISGATHDTLRGWLRGVKPGGLPHHPRPRSRARGGPRVGGEGGWPRSDPVCNRLGSPRRGTRYVTGPAESNPLGGRTAPVSEWTQRPASRSAHVSCNPPGQRVFPPGPPPAGLERGRCLRVHGSGRRAAAGCSAVAAPGHRPGGR